MTGTGSENEAESLQPFAEECTSIALLVFLPLLRAHRNFGKVKYLCSLDSCNDGFYPATTIITSNSLQISSEIYLVPLA